MIHVLKRTAVFVAIVLAWALPAAAANAATRNVVSFSGFSPGTIVVKTHERHLYYVLDGGRALRFPVGVGRAGMTGPATHGSKANLSSRPGRRPLPSAVKIRVCPRSFPVAPPTIRWARPRSPCAAVNTPSMAPIARN
jgi:hypothetical protein